MTRAQEEAMRAESAARGVPEHVVMQEIVEAGFAAWQPQGAPDAGLDGLRDEVRRLSREVAGMRRAVRAGDKAVLAWASWASFAAFDMLRAILRELGRDPDGDGSASGAMARYMSTTDCNVPTNVWESAGRRMADGDSYHDALVAACRENGVAWERFSGAAPNGGKGREDAEGQQKGGRADGGKRRKGGKR